MTELLTIATIIVLAISSQLCRTEYLYGKEYSAVWNGTRAHGALQGRTDDVRKNGARPAAHPNVFGEDAKYRTATLEETRTAVSRWLAKAHVSEDVRGAVEDLWKVHLADQSGPGLLQRLGESFALVDPRARQVVQVTKESHRREDLPSLAWLGEKKDGEGLPPFFRDNLRLVIGRWLCQERLYDEAIAVLRDVKPESVVDPASLLFYRSVAYHRLLVKKEGLESIRVLLDEVGDSPQRYVAVASLMERDLQALRDGSLDDISRRMEDVERLLGLSRAGRAVRTKEDKIVDMLQQLIDDLERQQPGADPSPSPGDGRDPARQPGAGGGNPAGKVDPRPVQGQGWRDLPPKERQESLQQLGKDFPAHYRAAIEQYFRRIANDTKP